MWQRFTERARRVVFFAQEEAGKLGESYVSTEHLLLGIVREDDSVASRILDRMGISLKQVRAEIMHAAEKGDGKFGQDMQLTPRAKRVIDLAYDEARQLNNNYIGTEHLLLGLIREGDGLAGRILAKVGADIDRTRAEVLLLQANPRPDAEPVRPDLTTDIVEAKHLLRVNELELVGKSILSMGDLQREQIGGILQVADAMRKAHAARIPMVQYTYPKSVALLFEKPSLRTRVTFALGVQQLGGHVVALLPQEVGMGTRESVPDVARNLERWVDLIVARVFDHKTLVQLKENSRVPIINALSDLEHPCQVLADLYTIQQKKGKLEGLKLAWLGDGYNMLHSFLLGCATVGMSLYAACPEGFWPDPKVVEQARMIAGSANLVEVSADPVAAVQDADVVATDIWVSMGQEDSDQRRTAFAAYQVNQELMAHAKPDAIFLECLPAHRGEEVTDEVLDGPQSVVFDEAENRLHVQKAILALLMGP